METLLESKTSPDQKNQQLIDKVTLMVEQSRVELAVEELFQLAPHCKEVVLKSIGAQPAGEVTTLPIAPALSMEKASLKDRGAVVQISINGLISRSRTSSWMEDQPLI